MSPFNRNHTKTRATSSLSQSLFCSKLPHQRVEWGKRIEPVADLRAFEMREVNK